MRFILVEEIIDESAKTDFIAKFGQQTLTNFDKAKQRLINNGYSTDYGQYLKMTEDELNNLILSLYDDKKDAQKKRMLQGKDKEIRGKYNYIGEYGGYKIYEPLDAQASMDLGVNTGWCTTGRYGHYGHPEFTPSIEDAKEHFDDYTSQGIRLFYFLNPRTMYGEYAIAVYSHGYFECNIWINNERIYETNFEIYNAKDEVDYSSMDKLPVDKLPIELELEKDEAINGLVIESGTVTACSPDLVNAVIPEGVKSIGEFAFGDGTKLESVKTPESMKVLGEGCFSGCEFLSSVELSEGLLVINDYVFSQCYSLKTITIPKSVKYLGSYLFGYCKKLKTIKLPEHLLPKVKHLGIDTDKVKIITY